MAEYSDTFLASKKRSDDIRADLPQHPEKYTMLTGDRPTGRLHLGHYVGSLKRRVELQNSGKYDEINILIADDQALTDNADNPGKIRDNIINVVLDYLSVGLDPAKTTICNVI